MNKIVGRPKTAGVRPPNPLGGIVVRMPIKEDKKTKSKRYGSANGKIVEYINWSSYTFLLHKLGYLIKN